MASGLPVILEHGKVFPFRGSVQDRTQRPFPEARSLEYVLKSARDQTGERPLVARDEDGTAGCGRIDERRKVLLELLNRYRSHA